MTTKRLLALAAAYGIVAGGLTGLLVDPALDDVALHIAIWFSGALFVLLIARYVARHPR